jgi:hypothetical protein
VALLVLAICAAFEGRFAHARELLSESTSIDEQLGGGRGSGFQYTRPAHADALTDLAEVLRLQNRAQEAAKAAKTARRLYEQKGNVVAAGKLQELLSMVGSGPRAITTTGEA